ncbi:MFS transporter, partial [Deinococcus pimensis]|uniref:MFS transporter n=1 Tax=Deinococcus pimensis TaxID=309888 RepID=UPI00048353A5
MAAAPTSRFAAWRARTFRALEVRTFRLFWSSQMLNLVGTWMQATAQSYLVLELTGNSSRALGLVNVAQFAPSLLLSLFAGALIDVLPKQRVLQATQLVMMLCALTLGVLVHTGHVTLPLILTVAFVAGTANAFNMPTRQSMVADFVPRDRLANAVALNSLSFNVSRTLGQALFGVVIPLGVWLLAKGDPQATSRLAVPFYLNAAAYVVAIAIQATLPYRHKPDGRRHNLLADTLEGLRYVRNAPGVLSVMLYVGGLSVTIINFNVIIPYFARAVFDVRDAGFGLLNAAFGAGAMIGALWQASKPNPVRNLRLGAVLLLGSSLLLAVTPNAAVGALVLAACGFSMLSLLISANSTVQLSINDALRGRVMSLYSFVLVGMAPPGALISGALISQDGPLGPRWGLAALAALGAVVVALLW